MRSARLRDALAVTVVVLFGVLPFPDEVFRTHGVLLVVALLPAVVLPLRRRRPALALAVSLVCSTVVALAGTLAPSALIAVAITAFSVTACSQADRTRRVLGVALAAVVVLLLPAVPLDGDLLDSRALQLVTFVVLAGALGDTSRSRREALAAATERAHRAERDRDDEARRRVVDERVRIARDLHDVVAHQISVISLSAGVASSSLETRPERAREALATVRSAARTVLVDIGSLMALLRSDDADGRDLAPQAGLSQVDELLGRFADAGLHVEVQQAADLDGLSPASDHVAYLALQEGLTNAHKHGADGTARVDLHDRDGAVVLTVTNPLRPIASSTSPSTGTGTDGPDRSDAAPGSPSSGHGLRGLRERVASVRGTAETTRADGEFRLVVTVPAGRRAGR